MTSVGLWEPAPACVPVFPLSKASWCFSSVCLLSVQALRRPAKAGLAPQQAQVCATSWNKAWPSLGEEQLFASSCLLLISPERGLLGLPRVPPDSG